VRRVLPDPATRLCALLGLALLAGSGAFFAVMFERELISDAPLHALVVRGVISTQELPGNFLFYATVALAAAFQQSLWAIHLAMTVVLALAVAAKFGLSAAIALRESPAVAEPPRKALAIAVALLCVAFSLPTSEIYVGQLPPNVWHNPTTIFLMPFAVALFWCSAQFLRSGERRWLWAVAGLAAVNVAAKPSFVLVLLVIFPLAALVRFRRSAATLEAWAACAFMALLVGLQYLYIYETDSEDRIYEAAGFAGEAGSDVRIDPFHVWGHLADNVPLSLLASTAFPIVALIVYRGRLLAYDLVRYALALMAVALAMFATFSETGVREFHGNFAWQAMVCNYILFLVVLVRVHALWGEEPVTRGRIAVAVAFLAHVVAGVVFLGYYVAERTYF
jgi:hypothetical protein